jgi:hypothetical protein
MEETRNEDGHEAGDEQERIDKPAKKRRPGTPFTAPILIISAIGMGIWTAAGIIRAMTPATIADAAEPKVSGAVASMIFIQSLLTAMLFYTAICLLKTRKYLDMHSKEWKRAYMEIAVDWMARYYALRKYLIVVAGLLLVLLVRAFRDGQF